MSEKTRNYTKDSIEVCRNCHGSGIMYSVLGFQPCEQISEPYTCPVCQGSGRIKKTLDVKITINPYCGEVVK